jgi:hypothetical protein
MTLYVALKDGMQQANEFDLAHLAVDFIRAGGVITSVWYPNPFEVRARATPQMSTRVRPGVAYVRGTNAAGQRMCWRVESDAERNVAIAAAHATLNRWDIVCLKIDTGTQPDADAANIASLVAITGTPASSPSVPATPSKYLRLAKVYVGANVSTITAGKVTNTVSEARLMPADGAGGPGSVPGTPDIAPGSITQTEAPTLVKLSGRVGCLIPVSGPSPPAVSTGGFKMQCGTKAGYLDGASYATLTMDGTFSTGIVSVVATDARDAGDYRNIRLKPGSSSTRSLKFKVSKYDGSSLSGQEYRINYIAIGW